MKDVSLKSNLILFFLLINIFEFIKSLNKTPALNQNIFKSFDSSSYTLSQYLISSNLSIANFSSIESNKTFHYKVNETEFNFTENIQENYQRFSMKIFKLYETGIEKEYQNVKLMENFENTNVFYS